MHIEIAIDCDKLRDYCMKEDTRIDGPWEYATYQKNGVNKKKCIEQFSMTEIERITELSPFAYIALDKAEKIYKSKKINPFNGPRTCIWIIGKPGVGNSRYVKSFGPYIKAMNRWWDGYEGQEDVLIDDYDKKGECLSHYMKLWADPYGELSGEIKGGKVYLDYRRLYSLYYELI